MGVTLLVFLENVSISHFLTFIGLRCLKSVASLHHHTTTHTRLNKWALCISLTFGKKRNRLFGQKLNYGVSAKLTKTTQYTRQNKLPFQMCEESSLNYLKFVKKYTVIFWLWNQGNYQLKFGRLVVYWVHSTIHTHNNNPTLELIWKPQNEWIHLVFCLFFSPTMLWLISFNFVALVKKSRPY